MAKLQFSLVTPEASLVSSEVDMVNVPGSEGELGVLIGHAPLITSLKSGVVKVFEGATVTQKIFVKGGFADIAPDKCTVLATTAITGSEINRAEVSEQLNKLVYQLQQVAPEKRAQLEADIQEAEAKLDAAS